MASSVTFHTDDGKRGHIIADPAALSCVKNKFSVKNPAAAMMKRKGRTLPSRLHAIDKLGRFDIGLYREIYDFLKNEGFQVVFTQEFEETLKRGYSSYELFDDLNFKLRDYQHEIVSRCLKHGWGTVKSATGSGKSLCIASLIRNIKGNIFSKRVFCLVVVPGLTLSRQLSNDFKTYGVPFTYGAWTTAGLPQDVDVVICNTELLLSQFEDNKWVENVDLLIVDECHKCKAGSKLAKMLRRIKTPNRFGFTGTFPEKKYVDIWKIIGTFGPLLYEKASKELRDDNTLTDVEVTMVKLQHGRDDKPEYSTSSDRTPTENYHIELNHVYNHTRRNEFIRALVSKSKGNSLVLVNHLEHIDIIEKDLRQIAHKRVYVVKGETEVDDRETIIAELEASDDIVCLAMSSIFSEGVNVKNLHNIFFIAAGKSYIRIVQGIGRGLRLHPTKNLLRLFDIFDSYKYSNDHANERKEIYNKEQIPWKEITVKI